MSEAVNQTSFSQNQEVLQAPPAVEISPEQEKILAEKAKKQKKQMYIGLGVSGVMVGVVLILSLVVKTKRPNELPDINFPSSTNGQASNWQQQIMDLKNRLKEYDPTDIELAPPPVDYKISLETESDY